MTTFPKSKISSWISKARALQNYPDHPRQAELAAEFDALQKIIDAEKKDVLEKEIILPIMHRIQDIVDHPDREKMIIDLAALREKSLAHFRSLGLPAAALRAIEASLNSAADSFTPEQAEQIKKNLERGLDLPILMPAPEITDSYLSDLVDASGQELAGLPAAEQYSAPWVWGDLKKEIAAKKLKTSGRPAGRPYLLFTSSADSVHPATTHLSAAENQKLFVGDTNFDAFKKKTPEEQKYLRELAGLTGMSLADFLIFERMKTQMNLSSGKSSDLHPDNYKNNSVTWLIASVMASGQVAKAYWDPGSRQLSLDANDADNWDEGQGFRPAAVLSL